MINTEDGLDKCKSELEIIFGSNIWRWVVQKTTKSLIDQFKKVYQRKIIPNQIPINQ